MDLQRNTHHVYRLMFHFVWIPRYRQKVFVEPQREAMKAIIKKIGYDYEIDIVELEIPEDHIHMIVRGVPKQSPSRIMQIIKSISAREFFIKEADLFTLVVIRSMWINVRSISEIYRLRS